MINYYLHKNIDKQKWDNCIQHAHNELIYAYSWYLDIVSPHWDALIQGDYEMVMPLPKKRKYRITYLIQPLFTQQLGIFYKKPLTSKEIQPFFDYIYNH